MITVACVLRSGGDYTREHVINLYRDVQRYWPEDGPFLHFTCLTDVKIRQHGIREVPLIGGWPGWWSKMELMRPDLPGDLLYFDLDTVVIGPLRDFARPRGLTLLADFYRPGGLQSALMYLPEADRGPMWDRWIADPAGHIARLRRGKLGENGDQNFLEEGWLDRAERWQDVLPGQAVSYKVDVRGKGVPKGARVICFHGKPRPWDVPLTEIA